MNISEKSQVSGIIIFEFEVKKFKFIDFMGDSVIRSQYISLLLYIIFILVI